MARHRADVPESPLRAYREAERPETPGRHAKPGVPASEPARAEPRVTLDRDPDEPTGAYGDE